MRHKFQARVYLTHPDELVLDGDVKPRDLPEVTADSAAHAAELASRWYGEDEPADADGASILLEPRLVEVRRLSSVAQESESEAWERFVVEKRLEVSRQAESLGGLPVGWLPTLEAAWRTLVQGLSCRLEDVEAFDAWESQGQVQFRVRFVDGWTAYLKSERGAATRVVRALLSHYIAYRICVSATDTAASSARASRVLSELRLSVGETRGLVTPSASGREETA